MHATQHAKFARETAHDTCTAPVQPRLPPEAGEYAALEHGPCDTVTIRAARDCRGADVPTYLALDDAAAAVDDAQHAVAAGRREPLAARVELHIPNKVQVLNLLQCAIGRGMPGLPYAGVYVT